MATAPNATSMTPSSSSPLLPADSPPAPLIDLTPPPPDSSLLPPTNTVPPPDFPPPPPADSPPPPSNASSLPPESPPPPSNASSLPPESPPPPSNASSLPPESPPPPPTDPSIPAASPPPPVAASSPTSVEPPPPPPPPPFDSWSPPTPPAPPPPKRKHLSPPPPPTDMSPQPSNWSSTPTRMTPGLPSTPSWGAPPSRPSPPGSAYSDVANSIPAGNNSNGGGIQPGTAVGIGFGVGFAALLAGIVIWCLKQPKKKSSEEYPRDYVRPSPIASSQTSGKYPSSSGSPYAKSPSVPLMKGNSDSHAYPYLQPDTLRGNVKSWFTYEELAEATDGFAHHNLLGEGGFGCVFKGQLTDGAVVAVKQLKAGGGQGEREFQAEIETISRVHHRHLVSLVGYCISDNQRLLVYEYLPNNTLHYHLHGHGKPILDWATRVRIAAGASRGLAYLHEDCHPRIIHRDIKSSNILLDENFEAQVADFGLARITADTNTHVSTRVMGTFGYLAPEYASSGKLTDRSDVFSFGVVLLEIITGRKPVDSSRPLGEESLVDWARPLLSHALETSTFDDVADPKLEKNYDEGELFRMVEAAAACVRYNASMRPRMGRVMRALDALTDSDLDNGVKPGQSKAFDRAAKSDDLKLFQKTAFGSQDYSSDFSRSSWRSRDL